MTDRIDTKSLFTNLFAILALHPLIPGSAQRPNRQVVLLLTAIIILMCTLTSVSQHARQNVATIPGDLVIGALFPVHLTPGPKQAQTRTCGEVWEQYGIHRVEAAFQTIDNINKDESILPNITLGIEIRDSCWYSAIALEQSIEFIRDAMAASDEKAATLQSKLSVDPWATTTPQQTSVSAGTVLNSNPFISPMSPFLKAPFLFTPTLNTSAICPKTFKKVKNIVGVIGPASSTVTIQVQNLLQLFNIPQIGYSATSRDLSIKSYYKYFLRVVPSDLLQARVMVDLVRSYNWTYISVVYSDGNYGSSLMEVFKGLAQDVGICIAYTESAPNAGDDERFDEVVRNLQPYRSARVVACFCEGMTVRGLLKSTKRLNLSGEFLFVGSDGWADRPDVVQGLEQEAVGGISVRIFSPYVDDFDEYYFNLNPVNNSRNPWFREFWESRFKCSLQNLTGTTIKHSNGQVYTKPCTGKESLKDNKHKQDTKMAFVKKAIWTIAYGLHTMQKSQCPNMTGLCSQMLPVNGSIFLQHLMNVSFVWGNETVMFDENGDPPGRYDIMNYQRISADEYDYIHVGSWISGGDFQIFRPLQWPLITVNGSAPPESVCSKPCPRAQAKNIQSDSVKCCWICVPCRENQYLLDEYTCQACPLGWWPNDNLTGCNQIPIEYLQWNETTSLVAMGIACLGFIMTLFAMIVFIRHNDTPIVKASTRELSYAIMIGMFLCYGTTFALVAKPTKPVCFVSRVLPGVSFAIMYAALVTKTNRIARILAGSKKRIITKKPRFMSGTAQVVITWLLISVECGIIATMLVREPADKMLYYPTVDKVQLICNTTPLGITAPLGFDFFLIAMCTVYAVKTRNVPENFNEAKFIGFTMYTTLVIWIAFVPIYFNSNAKVITMCLCISFSAIVALVLLFFPKIYIMLFKPEKNNRSYFTTAKNVRCHIGYVPTMGVSRHSSHSTSEFSMESPRNHSLDVHFKRESGATPGFHQQSVDKKAEIKRKQGLNLFERFRISKQDKIAANVQQHIRAVRAAEALDRQTGRNRRKNSSKLVPQRSSSSGEEESVSSDARKMRLVAMLRQAYGHDIERVPGFIEFAESAKVDSRRSYVDASAQTSYDLLETWFPALRKRIAQSEKVLNNVDDEDMPSVVKPNHKFTQSKFNHKYSQKHLGLSDRSSPLCSPKAAINHGFGEENSEEIEMNEKFTLRTSSPSTSDSKNETNRLELDYRVRAPNDESLTGDRQLSECRHRISADKSKTALNIQTSQTSQTSSSSPKYERKHKSVNKTMSSDESLLSGAGSLVIEESASSGGESSPGSGIYKNIIINLGGLAGAAQPDYHNLSVTPTTSAPKVNNIDNTSAIRPDIKTKKNSK